MLSGSSDRTHCRSVVELAARGQGPSGNSSKGGKGKAMPTTLTLPLLEQLRVNRLVPR